MPLRPPAYDLPQSGGPASTGAGYGKSTSTGALTPSGGNPGVRIAQMNTESLAGFWKSVSTIGAKLAESDKETSRELAKAEAAKQKAILDNQVAALYSGAVQSIEEMTRQWKVETGERLKSFKSENPLAYDEARADHLKVWNARLSGLLKQVDGLTSNPDVKRSLTQKLAPHLLEAKLKSGLYSDALVREETIAQIKKFGADAEKIAGTTPFGEPFEEAQVQGSISHAFRGLNDVDDRIDAANRRGVITAGEASEWKRKFREMAYYARAEALARELPDVFTERAKNSSDPVLSVIDVNSKNTLMKRAEERSAHLRSLRLSEDAREDKIVKESQGRWLGVIKSGMDAAFQTKGNLTAFAQEIDDMGHLLGPEAKSRAYDHLRVLQTAARERDAVKNTPWSDTDHLNYANYRAKVYSGAITDPSQIMRDGVNGQFRPDKADELVTLLYGINEDTRKAEIQEGSRHVKAMIDENIGLITKFNSTAARSASLAVNDFTTNALRDKKLTGAALTKYADEVINRYTRAVQTQIGTPEALMKTLPEVGGKRVQSREEVTAAWRAGHLREAEAERALAVIKYIESVQKTTSDAAATKGQKKGEPSPQQKKPSVGEKVSDAIFGKSLPERPEP